MPTLFYFLQIIVYSGLLWLIYCYTFRKQAHHRASRIFLLLLVVLPLILPFLKLKIAAAQPLWIRPIQLKEILVRPSGSHINFAPASTLNWMLLYGLVAVALFFFYTISYSRVLVKIRARINFGESPEIRVNTGIGPGSIWKTIFFPSREIRPEILRHEQAHINAGHRYDLLLMQMLTVLCWVNPFTWIVLQELKLVHEFEADALATENANIEAYTELLLSQTFDTKLRVIHAFSRHPLKRRILMLQKNQPVIKAKTTILFATFITAMVMATIVLAQSSKAVQAQDSRLKAYVYESYKPYTNDFRNAALRLPSEIVTQWLAIERKHKLATAPPPTQLPDGRSVYEYVETMPSFKGSAGSFMYENLKYPASAKAKNQEGRVLIQFIVDENGVMESPVVVKSSGFKVLDDEALRVVNLMKVWNAGEQNGKPVSVFYTQPINFSLHGGGEGC